MLPTTPRRQPRSMCSSCSMPFSTTATRVSRGVTLTRISSDSSRAGLSVSDASDSLDGAACRTCEQRRRLVQRQAHHAGVAARQMRRRTPRRGPGWRRRRPCRATRRWRRRRRCRRRRAARTSLRNDHRLRLARRRSSDTHRRSAPGASRPDSSRSIAAASSASPACRTRRRRAPLRCRRRAPRAPGTATTSSRPGAGLLARDAAHVVDSAASPGRALFRRRRRRARRIRSPSCSSNSRRRGDCEARNNMRERVVRGSGELSTPAGGTRRARPGPGNYPAATPMFATVRVASASGAGRGSGITSWRKPSRSFALFGRGRQCSFRSCCFCAWRRFQRLRRRRNRRSRNRRRLARCSTRSEGRGP